MFTHPYGEGGRGGRKAGALREGALNLVPVHQTSGIEYKIIR